MSKVAVAKKKKTNARKDSDAALGLVLSAIKRKTKGDPQVAHLLSEADPLSSVTSWISSRFCELDVNLGGGWAVGRASEVFGAEASGKSALTHQAILGCQEQGGWAALLDFELAADVDKLAKMGIDPDRLVYLAPRHVEEGWEFVWSIYEQLKKKPPENPTLIVWDSIGGSVSKSQFEADDTRREAGRDRALAMATNCTKMFRAIAEVNAHLMWVNQVREEQTAGPFKKFRTVGGRAIKFAASQRVMCSRMKRIRKDSNTPPSGYLVRVTTDKCRLAPPHRMAEWILDFKHGPSPELTLLHALKTRKIVTHQSGGMYSVPWQDDLVSGADTPWLEHMSNVQNRKAAEAVLTAAARAALYS